MNLPLRTMNWFIILEMVHNKAFIIVGNFRKDLMQCIFVISFHMKSFKCKLFDKPFQCNSQIPNHFYSIHFHHSLFILTRYFLNEICFIIAAALYMHHIIHLALSYASARAVVSNFRLDARIWNWISRRDKQGKLTTLQRTHTTTHTHTHTYMHACLKQRKFPNETHIFSTLMYVRLCIHMCMRVCSAVKHCGQSA